MSRVLMGLLGSGEFEPWSSEVDRWLLDRAWHGDGGVLVLPTASAGEGGDVFDNWGKLGLAHYLELGVPAEVLPLKVRGDAERPELVRAIDSASMVFFSGGNPAYLSSVLAGSPFWEALREAMARGLAYAGCSAGVACLGETTPDSDHASLDDGLWKPGLGLLSDVLFGPHWDMLESWIPGATEFVIASVPDGYRLVGIEENTAVVGDGTEWSVIGRGRAHLLDDGAWREFAAGASFSLPLLSSWGTDPHP